jgi:hypothetical protein|tara:strand:- start:1193 stop:1399 length:207 start_codon:yes stop_codon:yes gene_type:complete
MLNKIANIFLSKEKKILFDLALHIVQSLDTKEERIAAANMVISSLEDGKITTIEWTKIGKSLGVFGKK